MNLKAEIEKTLVGSFIGKSVLDMGENAIKISAELPAIQEATERLLKLFRDEALEIVGDDIELRADVDDELRRFVPDIEQRSVDGVSPGFTNLYTRAIVKSVQTELRTKIIEATK